MQRHSLLLLLPQCPMDPASGAALVERTTCEMLAEAGWRVRAIATTASEAPASPAIRSALDRVGAFVGTTDKLRTGSETMGFEHRGVKYRLLNTGAATVNQARTEFADELDEMSAQALAEEIPDIVLTYGSNAAEVRRRRAARQAGARVVLSVHNFAYRSPDAFQAADDVITPSRCVSDYYRGTHGIDSTPLRMPLAEEDVVASVRQPVFYTFINPSASKGAQFFAHVLKKCNDCWPEAPFLVVESRATAAMLFHLGRACGVDIEGLGNLYIAQNTANAASIYAVTRVLLVPSLMEAAGKVAAEAMLNGIPVIASGRGGTPETVGSGGFVLPVCEEFESTSAKHVLENWIRVIGWLHRDEVFYRKCSGAAWRRSDPYRSGEVKTERVRFFEHLAVARRN